MCNSAGSPGARRDIRKALKVSAIVEVKETRIRRLEIRNPTRITKPIVVRTDHTNENMARGIREERGSGGGVR